MIIKLGVPSCLNLACVASVLVGLGSKDRPRNGIFGLLPARKMGRELKQERGGWVRERKETLADKLLDFENPFANKRDS